MKKWVLILIVSIFTIEMTKNLKAQVTVRDSVVIIKNIKLHPFHLLNRVKQYNEVNGFYEFEVEVLEDGDSGVYSYRDISDPDQHYIITFNINSEMYSDCREYANICLSGPIAVCDFSNGNAFDVKLLKTTFGYNEDTEWNPGLQLWIFYFNASTLLVDDTEIPHSLMESGSYHSGIYPSEGYLGFIMVYSHDEYAFPFNKQKINSMKYQIGWNIFGNENYDDFLIEINLGQLNHFIVNVIPDTICYSETSTITVQEKDGDDNDFDQADDTWLLFELDSVGSRLGHLVDYDTNGVTYAFAKAGGVKFLADGEMPDRIETVNIKVWKKDDPDMEGEASLVVKPVIHYFQVLANPDTICYSNTSTITVQGKDNDNNNVDLTDDTFLLFELDLIGSRLGHLIGYDENGVSYGYAKAGGVKFVANGEMPNSIETVNIKVQGKDNPEVEGEGKVLVKPNIKLEILKPSKDVPCDTLWITKLPKMPIDTCKAVLLYYNKGQITYNWRYNIEYELQTRKGDTTFTKTTTAMNSDITTWFLDFKTDDKTKFIGGNATVYLKAITENKTYEDTVKNKIIILGENPTKEKARENVGVELQVIMYKESRFRQFDNNGYPFEGPSSDFGICQLCKPPATEQQLWNWKENRAEGSYRLYTVKKSDSLEGAMTYPGRIRNKARKGILKPGYQNVTDFTTYEQVWKETFQRYCSGYFWEWHPNNLTDPNSRGEWRPRPDPPKNYSPDAWRILIDVNNGKYPPGWN